MGFSGAVKMRACMRGCGVLVETRGPRKACQLCRRAKWRAQFARQRSGRPVRPQPYQESPATIEATYQRALAQIKAERQFSVDAGWQSPLARIA